MTDKFLVQMIAHKNGSRSEPFITSLDDLKTDLENSDKTDPENYVLLVGTVDNDGNVDICGAPLFPVKSLLQMDQLPQEEVING